MVFRGYIGRVYFYRQQVSEKEPRRSAETILIFLGRYTRPYVVVMFDLWQVRCLQGLHSDRDGGEIRAWLIGGTSFCTWEQLERVFSFVSCWPLTDVVTAVQPEGGRGQQLAPQGTLNLASSHCKDGVRINCRKTSVEMSRPGITVYERLAIGQ